mgnify:CR=1 FL=1
MIRRNAIPPGPAVVLLLTILLLSPALPGTRALHAQEDRTVPPPVPARGNETDGAREILRRYVDAWRGPEEMTLSDTLIVGFRFSGPGGGDFHVVLAPDGGAALREGVPADAIRFHGDMEILQRLDRGEISAMTAMGRAHMSDRTPLDFQLPEGFQLTPAAQAVFLPFVFHFFNREWPEVVRFGEGTTRRVHGGNAAILYYDLGFRSGFYQIEPGMHVNEEEDQQVNVFQSLFIVIRGSFQSRLDGRERTLQEGEAVLVPAGMTHEFWAGEDQHGEMIMIAFGKGA